MIWPGLWLTPVAAVGWLGVHLFFVLSGFLLAYGEFSRAPEQRRYGRFVERRFLRIFPAYYLQLAILLVAGTAIGMDRTLSTGQVLGHIFMYFNLPPQFMTPLNGVWWTLPVEFAFYLLLPFLVPLVTRIGPVSFWLGCAAVEIGYRYLVFALEPGWSTTKVSNVINQLPGVLTLFGSGVAAAHLAAVRGWRASRPRLLGGLATIAWAVWIGVLLALIHRYWGGHPLLFTWGLGSGAAAAILIYALHRLEPGRSWLTRPAFVWLGDVSYGIYLWHFPVITALNHFWLGGREGTLKFILLISLTAAITLALSALSYYAVERPAMRLGRHRTRLRRADPQAW